MRKRLNKIMAIAAVLCVTALNASAQITNDPSVITDGISDHYNTAAGLGIGALVVGMAIYFIRKGAKLRA